MSISRQVDLILFLLILKTLSKVQLKATDCIIRILLTDKSSIEVFGYLNQSESIAEHVDVSMLLGIAGIA